MSGEAEGWMSQFIIYVCRNIHYINALVLCIGVWEFIQSSGSPLVMMLSSENEMLVKALELVKADVHLLPVMLAFCYTRPTGRRSTTDSTAPRFVFSSGRSAT